MTLSLQNPNILTQCRPFVVATDETFEALDHRPFGLTLESHVHPFRLGSAPFLDRLKRLDELCFGPEGMPMPRWVFLDGAEIPGIIFGFALPAEHAPPDVHNAFFSAPTPEDQLPLSMFAAIPTIESGTWFAHNLSSAAALFPALKLKGLGSLTKAVGLKLTQASTQMGATQWTSRALHVHTKLGPLELLSAHTPAHGEFGTLTYRVTLRDDGLRQLAGAHQKDGAALAPTRWVRAHEVEDHIRLQALIEAGESAWICGAPRQVDGAIQVPVHVAASR